MTEESLSLETIRRLRLTAQRLTSNTPPAPAAERVRDVLALQAQDEPAARLSLRARNPGITAAAVASALGEERSLARTWLMRGTLHIVAADDLEWLLPLLGPVFIRKGQRRRAELGLSGEPLTRGVRLLYDHIKNHGPQTRAELSAALAAQGIPTEGQALIHLINHAALEGKVIYGPRRGKEETLTALDDWLPIHFAKRSDALLAELARRYLAAYGPAGPHDLAAWSGLAMSEAQTGLAQIAAELKAVDLQGKPGWALKNARREEDELAGCVKLLPAFDTLLLGYASRDWALDAAFAKRVNRGGGIIHPTVLAEGKVRGIWKLERKGKKLDVRVEPFEEWGEAVSGGIEREAGKIREFYESYQGGEAG